ncbi:MAG: histidine phosphatase family protein [Rubrivivax sp.]|nr:MAG: histidine phosphatase family protein [Rubrivivax sp.]
MGAIYLIRHGQASFGSSNYDQLSKVGHEQARVLGESLKTRIPKVDLVVTGSMQRHQATAQTCLEAMGLTLGTTEHAGFNEFDHEQVIHRAEPRYVDNLVMMGEMAATGDPRRAFQAFFRTAVGRWVAGEHDHEYTESWRVFQQRCHAAMDEIIAQTGPSGTALVFTSGGFISAICQRMLAIPDEHAFTINWTLVNAGVSKLVLGKQGAHLITINEHSCFEGPHANLLTYR